MLLAQQPILGSPYAIHNMIQPKIQPAEPRLDLGLVWDLRVLCNVAHL
jgi:hypothetical protein